VVHQLLVEQRVGDPEQEEHVRTGPDEMVGVGDVGGLGAARVHHDDPAAARAHRLGLAAEVGHRPQAAVRDHRIGAEDQQEVAALDVGHRYRQPGAEHQSDRQHLRHLVDAGRGKHIARAERAGQSRKVQHQAHFMRSRIAQHRADRVGARRRDHRRQPPLDFGIGFVPGGFDEAAVALDERRAQAVGIVLQLFQADRLRAQETAREHVLPVAANAHHALLLELDPQAAARLAKRTDSVGCTGLLGHGVAP
jgi:hypothetical protein